MGGKLAEYIWIDEKGNLRSKSRYLKSFFSEFKDIPEWNFDGSSTGQAPVENSEIVIKSKAMFRDPFRVQYQTCDGGRVYPHKLILCDTYKPDGTPTKDNNRVWAKEIFDRAYEEEPWFGLEQEYFLIDPVTLKPLGFPLEGEPKEQGQYYCSAGFENNFGREIAEEHLMACLTAGIKISGINSEVAPGQWEFQIGPCVGIEVGDHLWVARYLLQRIAEKHKVIVNFEPKPVKGDWNGSGCHTNYSTEEMREGTDEKTGLEYINNAIEKLSFKHDEHMALYGSGNELRMTGKYETAQFDKFTSGIANRTASIRIPNTTIKNKKGYLEDRRPSSNMDPYLVTGIIFNTTVLES